MYRAISGVLGRTLFEFDAEDTWALRARCRQHVGKRRSGRMRYRKIGANTFRVETQNGRVIMEVYRVENWGHNQDQATTQRRLYVT